MFSDLVLKGLNRPLSHVETFQLAWSFYNDHVCYICMEDNVGKMEKVDRIKFFPQPLNILFYLVVIFYVKITLRTTSMG